jgi:hypothetical protein
LRFARPLFDLWGDGLTFRATVPRVEPIDRATVVRKSLSFAAGLRSVIFIVIFLGRISRRRVFRIAIGAFPDIGGLAHLALDLINAFLRALRHLLAGCDRPVQIVLRAFQKVVARVVA